MSEKCEKCGQQHDVPRLTVSAKNGRAKIAAEVNGPYAITGCVESMETMRVFAANLGIWLEDHACLIRQLAQSREREATEKARADKLQEKVDRLHDGGLDGPCLIDDSQAFSERIDEFRDDQSNPLTLTEQRELAEWWAERGTLVADLDDRCCAEMDRAEKAEAEIKRLREYVGTCEECGRPLQIVDSFCGPCQKKWEDEQAAKEAPHDA